MTDLDFELLGQVAETCGRAEYGSGGAEMRRRVDALLASGGSPTVERDEPWLTDVFFRRILAGEDVQTMVKRELLAQWRTFQGDRSQEASAKPVNSSGEGMACDAAGERREPQTEDPVIAGDRQLRLLSPEERAAGADGFRKMLEGRSAGTDKTSAIARAWLGRHGPLPLVPYRAWAETERQVLAHEMAADEFALDAAETKGVSPMDDMRATALLDRREALASARDPAAAKRLAWLSDDERVRLAGELDALDLLYRMIAKVTYGLDRQGVGSVPALHVAGRRTRDGGLVGTGADEIDGANAVLDALAMDAFLWFAGTRPVGSRRVCDFGPLRRYLEGPANARYLVGMIQDAVAGRRGQELADPTAPRTVKEYADAPLREDEEGNAQTLADTFAAEPSDDEGQERARFFRQILGKLAPDLLRYFKLVRGGMPRGEALKAVGAKSAHFVEREAKALLGALDGLKGDDFADLAELVRGIARKD